MMIYESIDPFMKYTAWALIKNSNLIALQIHINGIKNIIQSHTNRDQYFID